MSPKEASERLGITTQQLFDRAHAMYGRLWGLAGPSITHALWIKNGIEPMYVIQYIRHLERRVFVHGGLNGSS